MSKADQLFLYGILFQMWGAIEDKGDRSMRTMLLALTLRVSGIIAVIGSFFVGD